MDKYSKRTSDIIEEGEISSNNESKKSRKEDNSSSRSNSKARPSRSQSPQNKKKSRNNKKHKRSISYSHSRSISSATDRRNKIQKTNYKEAHLNITKKHSRSHSSSTEKISKSKKSKRVKNEKEKHSRKHKSRSKSHSRSRSNSHRKRRSRYHEKEREKENERMKRDNRGKKTEKEKKSYLPKSESINISVGLNKLNAMSFSTKQKTGLLKTDQIKYPIEYKSKKEEKNHSNTEKTFTNKIKFEEKNNSIEENLDFYNLLDDEQRQKEQEKERDLRRLRLEQIKQMNENLNKDNNSNTEEKEETTIKLPSHGIYEETASKVEEQAQDEEFNKENEIQLDLKLAEELDFIKDGTDIDINLKLKEISPEENQRLLELIQREREKAYQEQNYDYEDTEFQLKKEAENQRIHNKNEMEIEDDEDKVPDMFAETPVDGIDPNKKKSLNIFTYNEDNTGYYTPKLGEIINNQYKVTGICGKGIFSTVVKAIDIITNYEYAIKIVRNIDVMMISAEKEKNIIKKLNEIDKHDKTFIIRMVNTFEIKRHICMVFELCDMNLRDFLKSKSNQGGIGLNLVKLFARQLLIAFALVHKLKIIHADYKPDNTVVSKNHKTIKLCDFGSALREDEIVITSELVSRFYRAPEILLGCHYDTKIDIWSLGCTLYEIYTGKILFPGRNNNEMIKLIMQVKGKFPQKILKRGQFTNHYFNEKGQFFSHEIDSISKKEYLKELEIPQNPTKDLLHMLKTSFNNNTDDEKNLVLFKDFLEKCLHLDPNKRFSAVEALCHPFIEFNPLSHK